MAPIDQARSLCHWPDADAVRLLQDLTAETDRLVRRSDLDAMDVLIARTAGLRRRCRRMGAPTEVTDALDELVVTLEARRGVLAFDVSVARAAERRPSARDRVLAELAVPRRPVELAVSLGLDPANIARALRELRLSGKVAEIPATGADDRRARAYVASANLQAEIARTRAYLAELCAAAERADDRPVTAT